MKPELRFTAEAQRSQRNAGVFRAGDDPADTVRPSDRPTVRPSDRPTVRPLPWPSSLPDQVRVLRGALEAAAGPIAADTLTARFKRAQTDRVAELLETLVIVGQARKLPDGRFTGKV